MRKKIDKWTLRILLCIVLGVPVLVHLGYHVIETWQLDRALVDTVRVVIPAQRGKIVDADGAILARTDTFYSLHYDPMAMRDSMRWRAEVEGLAVGLDAMFPLEDSSAGWLQAFVLGRQQGRRYMKIADGITGEQVDSIRKLPLFNLHSTRGGGIIEARPVRVRPFGSLAAGTIGAYREEDKTRTGLEKWYDYELYGRDGMKKIRKGRYEGRYVEKTAWVVPAVNGNCLQTTLCMWEQALADSILRNAVRKHPEVEGGTIVVMSRSGAIRVMANLIRTEGGWHDADNWAVGRIMEPGRLADAMSYAALLSDGHIRSIEDAKTSGTGAAHLVLRHYGDNPVAYTDRIRSYLPDLDFDLDMAGNRIPAPGTREWTGKTLSGLSAGEGLGLTPLSLLTFFNAIANGGRMTQPYLVGTIVDGNGRCVREHAPVDCGEIPASVADSLGRWMAGKDPGNGAGGQDVSGLSGACRDAAAYVGFSSGYSIVCTLFFGGGKPSQGMLAVPEKTAVEVLNNL